MKSLLYAVCAEKQKASRVIFYHDVHAHTEWTDMGDGIELFKRHLEIAEREGFRFVKEISSPLGELQICFDDGFRGIWDCRDFFVRKALRPTVFLAVSLIGQPGYLTEEEILELQSLGFDFQGHSWNHDNLPHYTEEELRHELVDSKRVLEDMLGKELDAICFPQGLYSDAVVEMCKTAGYKKYYSSVPGRFHEQIPCQGVRLIPRSLVQHLCGDDFKHVLHNGDRFLKKSRTQMHYIR